MLIRATSLLIVCAALLLSSAQVREEIPSPIYPVDGAAVFRHYCAPCHGEEAQGSGSVSQALKPAVPYLTSLSRRNSGKFPTDRVENTIMFGDDKAVAAHGSKKMPIWGPIFHQIEFDQDYGNVRLENVTEYIRSIQTK